MRGVSALGAARSADVHEASRAATPERAARTGLSPAGILAALAVVMSG